MDRLYVGFLIGFVLGVWISFIVVVIAVRSTRRSLAPPRTSVESPSQLQYNTEPATTASQQSGATPPQQANAEGKPVASASPPTTTTASARPPASYRNQAQANSTTQQLFHSLLGMTAGDEAATNRLIEYDRQRAPRASLEIWLRNAIDRLVQDRR